MPNTKGGVMKFSPKTLKKRIWIEGFRLKATHENKIVSELMEQWKRDRQRPTHFTRAIKLYVSLLEGDIDTFFDVLIEFAPKTALRLMRQAPPAPNIDEMPASEPQPKPEKRKPIPPPQIIDTTPAQSATAQIDALADSLGMGDLDFGE